jgi:thymidylate kinase
VTWEEGGENQFLKLDICSDYYRDARFLLGADRLLSNRYKELDSGFYYPAPEDNFLYYLIKKVDKGSISESKFGFLVELFSAGNSSDIHTVLMEFWPSEDADRLLSLFDQKNLDQFKASLAGFQKTLLLGTIKKKRATFAELRRFGFRITKPAGVWIAIYGPDGCGKSSVIEQLRPKIIPYFRKIDESHFRPYVGGVREGDGSPVPDPHAGPDRSFLVSILKLLYYWADYVVGYFLKVLPGCIRSTFYIFDRYYDDICIDPKRYSYGGPRWLLSVGRLVVPKPKLIFCLDAEPEILQARKKEVSFEECHRQRNAYRSLVQQLPYGHVVDASQPLEDVVRDVQGCVLAYMAERTTQRMKKG